MTGPLRCSPLHHPHPLLPWCYVITSPWAGMGCMGAMLCYNISLTREGLLVRCCTARGTARGTAPGHLDTPDNGPDPPAKGLDTLEALDFITHVYVMKKSIAPVTGIDLMFPHRTTHEPTGPVLGHQLRAPIRAHSGGVPGRSISHSIVKLSRSLSGGRLALPEWSPNRDHSGKPRGLNGGAGSQAIAWCSGLHRNLEGQSHD